MKHKIGSVITFLGMLFVPSLSFAQAPAGGQFINLIGNLIITANLLVTLLFVVALLVFAWGIVKFLFAAGDPTAVKNAKGFILWGVVGMAVLASLFGIITFLQQFFGVSGTSGTLKAPDIQGVNIRLQ